MQDNLTHNNVPLDEIENPLEDLQNLVLGLKPHELKKLQFWLKDSDNFTGDISSILPDAVVKSFEKDKSLSDALLPVIESAIFVSVQKNPEALANALFPIMGPAIRQSIAETFRKMIQSLNDTLEKQFSMERIKWRFEAIFSSKSYAEIVLLKGLKYNVLAAMLIHKESGLLINEAHNESQEFDEADMISSMLKAVQDFVHDSFNNHINDTDTLDSLRLNELNIWIIDGPFAFLAVVIDGETPESKRDFFKSQLETIHHKFGNHLKNYDGDDSDFKDIKPLLKQCLIGNNSKEKIKTKKWKLIIPAIAIIILIIGWISVSIYNNIKEKKLIASLKNIESVVIINNEEIDGKQVITIMKDASLSANEVYSRTIYFDTANYHIKWINYLSTDITFVLKRFKQYAKPGKTVDIGIIDNVIEIRGKASQEWIDKAKKYVDFNSGQIKADFSNLETSEPEEFIRLKALVESINLKFDNGVSILNKNHKKQLDTLSNALVNYEKFEKIKQFNVLINLDIEGNDNENLRFAKLRQRSINRYLSRKELNINNINYNIVGAEHSEDARKISFKIISE
jgi:OOP family OmpA-OmpF porin